MQEGQQKNTGGIPTSGGSDQDHDNHHHHDDYDGGGTTNWTCTRCGLQMATSNGTGNKPVPPRSDANLFPIFLTANQGTSWEPVPPLLGDLQHNWGWSDTYNVYMCNLCGLTDQTNQPNGNPPPAQSQFFAASDFCHKWVGQPS